MELFHAHLMPRQSKKTTSAGGLVIRETVRGPEVLVVKRTRNVEPKWQPVLCQLPKGRVEPGESLETTAIREVREETGINPEITGFIGKAAWSYERDGVFWAEEVHYFLMSLASPKAFQKDDEFDKVEWLPLKAAAHELSYPEEKRLLSLIGIPKP